MGNKKMNISTFIGCDKSYEEASLVLFGVPFDGTTSFRPGTRFAMQAIRTDSYGLETYSPYLDRDLENIAVFDGGDLDLPFGNTEKVMDIIFEYSRGVLTDGKKFLMVGGEHLVSLSSIKAAYEKYSDLHLIHIDAHTDLREHYLGEKLSHASVIRNCHGFLGDGRIFQFGIRSGLKEEFEWAKEHTYLEKFSLETFAEKMDELANVPVYITIDLDVLDPGIFPGTGTPEPGGISYRDLLDAIGHMQKLNQIVAADVVELSPPYDPSGASTAVACKTVREMLLTLGK
ncbi:agmatinase [Caldifermentibacillus hisashii]|jgi:agmatinase|uniref:Agmatinase n=2 Tax=Bacillaceae TaxID=186817 RepID=A0A090IUG4_9BACI|nr:MULTISPECIES: agmatinase [Bacillaceae]MCB5936038.1 agmatinase [Bacillus sp. DFI.2.34]AWI12489.1 agmatinase [Caldibacillus thermoamylovorans]KIO64826.1 Agmatinase [Caldibacillus thermoamylovorans]KIO64882.1 Agmatinase [Caldibacillus thermoamylovorans]KIO74022.1 Agmatinase [Caldibacillus thermoamylovorans]